MLVAEREKKNVVACSEVLRGRDILCFSHDWTGDPLSKTHLMRVLSKENRILWINAIANRMPTASSKDVSRIFKKLKSFAEPVREVTALHQAGENHDERLWFLVNFEMWQRRFFDGESSLKKESQFAEKHVIV